MRTAERLGLGTPEAAREVVREARTAQRELLGPLAVRLWIELLRVEAATHRLAGPRGACRRARRGPARGARGLMQLPGTPSLVFLLYLFVFLPYLAFRSARLLGQLRGGTASADLPNREAIWIRTILSLGVLFALAWMVGRTFDYDLFAVPALGPRPYALAAGALVLFLVMRLVVRAVRTEEEERRLIVYALAPRTAREWAWAVGAILVASVAEEAAYRGVAMSILWYSTGNPWLSAVLCAIAFALAHWMQGWKSGAFIFVMALVFHALCVLTGTLVLAMVVHAIYDLAAAVLIARKAERIRATGGPAASGAPA